jgi:pyrimidine operon attenuation protein / uracil phosphoribosyltransferase
MTVSDKTLILDARQVKQKIKRMAYEIYENHSKDRTVVIAGIDGQGYTLAKLLAKELEAISPIKTVLTKVQLNKTEPQQDTVYLDSDLKEVKKRVIVVVDDVLNTGRTLAYSLKPFLDVEVKCIEIAVLVNRSHSSFPILPKYTGYELATTIKDHVEVVLGKETAVYLK